MFLPGESQGRGVWWAAFYGVAQSWTRLKWLSSNSCNGWMASLKQWTWTWANFGRWWRAGRPGVLQAMGLQRVGHDLVTEQQQQWNYRLQPLGRHEEHQGFSISRWVRPLLTFTVSKVCPKLHMNGVATTAWLCRDKGGRMRIRRGRGSWRLAT